jgi:hypothetical protein
MSFVSSVVSCTGIPYEEIEAMLSSGSVNSLELLSVKYSDLSNDGAYIYDKSGKLRIADLLRSEVGTPEGDTVYFGVYVYSRNPYKAYNKNYLAYVTEGDVKMHFIQPPALPENTEHVEIFVYTPYNGENTTGNSDSLIILNQFIPGTKVSNATFFAHYSVPSSTGDGEDDEPINFSMTFSRLFGGMEFKLITASGLDLPLLRSSVFHQIPKKFQFDLSTNGLKPIQSEGYQDVDMIKISNDVWRSPEIMPINLVKTGNTITFLQSDSTCKWRHDFTASYRIKQNTKTTITGTVVDILGRALPDDGLSDRIGEIGVEEYEPVIIDLDR